MNKQLSNILKTSLVIGVVGVTSFSVIATPIAKREITLEQKVKEVGQGVCAIGYIEDTIVAINEETKQIIVGDPVDPEAQIIINVKEATTRIQAKDKKVYTFGDLKVGQKIGIESSGIMTDGQLDAFEINLVEEAEAIEAIDENVAVCPIAGYIQDTIVAIDEENKTIIFGDITDPESQVVVKVTEDTRIVHKKLKKIGEFKDLKIGQEVTMESNGIMTAGQVTGIEITIL